SIVLLSYIRQDGNFLEYEPLQLGALWGIGRLAQVRPQLAGNAAPYLLFFLKSRNVTLRGLAVWVLGLIGAKKAVSEIEPLLDDPKILEIYLYGRLKPCCVKDLAEEALKRIRKT
ncbi:MAG: HEAT repeat domain-containing protein, partial [Deltaproteobacteria bacterium]|nr:HEAT repeat domain-containing protein [Deltaproteobacteria bacterium]